MIQIQYFLILISMFLTENKILRKKEFSLIQICQQIALLTYFGTQESQQ